jgi:hypothetical protein
MMGDAENQAEGIPTLVYTVARQSMVRLRE